MGAGSAPGTQPHLLIPTERTIIDIEVLAHVGSFEVERGMAEMLKGGVIMVSSFPEQAKIAEDAGAKDLSADRRNTLNRLLFPGPTRDFVDAYNSFGDMSVLPTSEYLYGLRPGCEHVIDLAPGKQLLVGVQAVGDPDERGYRTVMCTVNGQLRPVAVRDRRVAVQVSAAEKADPGDPGHVSTPFQGVVTVSVAEGDVVAAGAPVASIEAMKMEAAITAPRDGTVTRVAITGVSSVDGGDLLLVIK